MRSFSNVARIGALAASLVLIPPTLLSPLAFADEPGGEAAASALPGADVVTYPGTAPGAAQATVTGNTATIGNAVISASIDFTAGPVLSAVRNVETNTPVAGPSKAVTITVGGAQYDLSTATVSVAPRVVDIAADSSSKRVANQIAGKAVEAKYRLDAGGTSLDVTYRAILREGANYVQQELTFAAVDAPVAATNFVLFDAPSAEASIEGRDTGYPITVGPNGAKIAWIGVENPLAQASVAGGRATISMRRANPVTSQRPLVYTTAVGVSPAGQIRRSFLNYFERESTHARRTFLHYQSWFDLKPGDAGTDVLTMPADQLTHAIDLFGAEASKRDMKLDSYWVDDGWDYLRDPQVADESNLHVWSFDPGQFGTGFAPQRAAAEKHGGSISVWMSPFGGYGTSAARRQAINASKPAEKRLETYGGRQFKLSGPKYYSHFRDTIFKMIDNDGVQGFKFDGIGGGLYQTSPAETYRADYEAMQNLSRDMRAHNEDVFINTTVGTWGSPYWMWFSDSIWRDGHDAFKVGEGSDQEQYVSYRDAEVYKNFVVEAPLVPITQLMNHGFIFSNRAPQFSQDTNLSSEATRKALAADMRGYFAQGFELQELYIRNTLVDPAVVGAANAGWFWDELAKNAKWARTNQSLLADAHWIGGDPHQVDVYGTAAWNPGSGDERAMFMVRNPSERPKHYTLDVEDAFELPAGTHGTYRCTERDGQAQPFVASKGKNFYVELDPFEVLLFECVESTEAPTDSTEPVYSPEFTKISKSGWLASANSEETTGENGRAMNAIDDNSSTLWHTKYSGGIDQLPHTLTVNMGAPNEVHRLTYTPRPGGGGNGQFKDYRIEVSTDGVVWQQVAAGQFQPGDSTQAIPIPEDKRVFQYFRLVGTSTHNNRPFGAAAEMTAYGVAAPSPYLNRTGWTAVADSQETQGEPTGQEKAIDGDLSSHWHTAYNPSIAPLPHQITLDMKKFARIDGFRYIPRQDTGTNGVIGEYRIETSRDCTEFTQVANGTFQGKAPSLVEFDEVEARCVRLVALSAQNGSQFAGAAELDVRGQWATVKTPDSLLTDDQPGTGNDTFTIPVVENVRFLINGNDVEPGVHTVPAGTTSVLVQAAAAQGYTLAEGAKTDYNLTFSVEGVKPEPAPAGLYRIAGANRVETAVEAAKSAAFTGTTAVLVSGTGFADAVTAGPLAGAVDGPLLLTTGSVLEPQVSGVLKQRGIKKVYVVGGQAAIADAKLETLRAQGMEAVRVAGSDRYATAVAVATEVERLRPVKNVFFADGKEFADALAAGPAAARADGVILLSSGDWLPVASVQYLEANAALVPTAVGGKATMALENADYTAGFNMHSVAGKDRYETARLLAQRYLADAKGAVIASGDVFADALSGGALAIALDSPLLLSKAGQLSATTRSYLVANRQIDRVDMMGGPASLSEEVAEALQLVLSLP